MSDLQLWTHSAIAIAVAKALLHSLWQAVLVAGGLAVFLAASRSSRLRYAAASCALLLVTVLPLRTIAQLRVRSESSFLSVGMLPAPVAPADETAASQNFEGFIRLRLKDALPWVTPLWLLGVVLFTLKNFVTWFGSRRIRWRGACAVSENWQQRLNTLQVQLGISKPVELLESCMTQIPVVIGHLRPVILLPVGLVSGLPTDQIEMILMHELAHIRRHDYLVNLLQTLVESVLFFNPAALWISKRIRTEREHCCDDDIVRITKDARVYAAALIALEAGRAAPPQNAIAATGGTLVNRIRRLLYPNETVRVGLAPILIAAAIVVAASVMLTARPVTTRATPELPQAPERVAAAAPVAEVRPVRAPEKVSTASPSPRQSQEPAAILKKWLDEDVSYIITNDERTAFNRLQSDDERAQFIQSFWLRRDPTPGTVENEFREEHSARMTYANQKFGTSSVPGWRTDRGRVYIIFGPPDELESHPAGGTYQRPIKEGGGTIRTFPFEMWRYRRIEGIGNEVLLEFVDSAATGEFRLTTPLPFPGVLLQKR